MVQKLSHNISVFICNVLNYEQEKTEVLSYGFQIFLGTLIKLTTILLLSYILGILRFTLIATISFILFRRLIGGSHCDSFIKCYLLSVLFMLGFGHIGRLVTISTNLSFICIAFVYILGLIVTIKWVPMGTEKKVIRNVKTRTLIKTKTIVMISILTGVLIYIQMVYNFPYVLSCLLGVLLAFILATPIGKKITGFEIIKKERGLNQC